MKLGSLVLSFLALACAGELESASLADSHGKFPGKGNREAYNRSLDSMNEGAKRYESQDFESAVKFTKQAITIYPFDSATHKNLGNALRKTGKLQESISEFMKAIQLEPNYLGAWLGLGLTYEALHNLPEAERCYRKGLEIKPGDFEALFDIGDILRQQGKSKEATTYLVKAKACPESKKYSTEVENALSLCSKQKTVDKKEASN